MELCLIALGLAVIGAAMWGLKKQSWRYDCDQKSRDNGELPYDYYKKGE